MSVSDRAYTIGDSIIYIEHSYETAREVCDQCFGKKFLTVILGNDEQVTIECQNCLENRGYGDRVATGYTNLREGLWVARESVVDGMEKNWGSAADDFPIRYEVHGHRPEKDAIFETLAEAKTEAILRNVKAEAFRDGTNESKNDRQNMNAHTWAFQASHYRRQIKNALHSIEYAKNRIEVANKYRRDGKTTHLPSELDAATEAQMPA